MLEYPDDEDGQLLRRIAADGSDMAQPMEVDFLVAVPDAAVGDQVADAAEALGYAVTVEVEEGRGFTCYCTKQMRLSHAAVVSAQTELDAIAEPLGAAVEAWGTPGNGPRGPELADG